MYSGRMTMQSSAGRKSRAEGKPSLLPKPWRQGSTDRVSGEARRPSNSYRSSSAEPVRATLGGRLSRDASATKVPLNRRSRSQQADKYGQSSTTPLRSSQYTRTTTTPVRTPSEDHQSRSWQASLDRALAFVTVKDQRPISTMAWQRSEFHRVLEGLAARGAGGAGGQPALTKPLTITRFVLVCGDLLAAIMMDTTRLNNDNYITKLPNLAKRFLYPGTMSKSWLKTVNTLHAFPHALAFLAFFLDLVNHIETPVSDEWLYAEKSEVECLRRDFLHRSWIRFQDPNPSFGDIEAEYIQRLRQVLGHHEDQVAQIKDTIKQCEATLEDESELAARAEEERLSTRREALTNKLKVIRTDRRAVRVSADSEQAKAEQRASLMRGLDSDINHITAEIQQLKRELETQDITVAERGKLLDEVDYATRVIDSKRTLAEQVSKMMLSKETELAVWQKRTLDSCVEYKQTLIQLAATVPTLAALAVDEQELMTSSCAESVSRAVETLRAHAQQLAELRTQRTRARAHHCRQRELLLEEVRAKVVEVKTSVSRLQQCVEAEAAREAADAAAWAHAREELARTVEELNASEEQFQKAQTELQFWEEQDKAWTVKLTEMREYIWSLRQHLGCELDVMKKQQADRILGAVASWHRELDRVEAEERELERKNNSRA